MTSSSSQVPAVLKALHAQLGARPAIVEVAIPVDLGWPAGGPAPNHIWIDGALTDGTWTESWANTIVEPPVPKEEEFVAVVNFLLTSPRASYADLLDRLFDLTAELDTQLAEDPFIDGTADTARIISGELSEEVLTEGGRRIFAERRIAVATSWPRG